jgi:hypothetical protein
MIKSLCVALLLAPIVAFGAVIYDVQLNTTPLIGHAAGPFSLNFQLNDGSGVGDANNTAVLSNFVFDGGAPAGAPTYAGGASGNVASSVTLTDSAFFNSFTQAFTAGTMLGFRVSLTTNVDAGGTPDQFSFAILDASGVEIPTQGLAAVGSDVLLLIDIVSPTPGIQTFGTDIFRLPNAGGDAINIAAPVIIPEPGSIVLISGGLCVLAAVRLRRRAG